ncbi:replication protein P [Shewanella sp. MBTL60-007]|uniref:replication protein P n=1 Tax=Shewanella sp. MBTL60-007 TaxID=2815911 RepID=UPI001BB84FC3|nr:replication protein P [Shewanella sp. MBTL60-007]GIU22159.1 DNA replication protein [Shewanella sp. MBTL60-007]
MTTKSLQTILNKSRVVGCGGSINDSPRPSDTDIAIVDSVFEKLRILFPIGAPKADATAIYKAEWLKTLAAQGVRSREQVQFGLNRARREVGDRQFWPTPRQFCAWCVPTANESGLPSNEEAFREALKHYRDAARHQWSHEVVWLAYRETGYWLFNRGSQKEVLEVFTRNYIALTRRFMSGEIFDIELPKALPQGGSIPTPPERAKAKISDLRRSFGLRGCNES